MFNMNMDELDERKTIGCALEILTGDNLNITGEQFCLVRVTVNPKTDSGSLLCDKSTRIKAFKYCTH